MSESEGENTGEDADSAGVLECPSGGRDAIGATMPLTPPMLDIPRPVIELDDDDVEIPAPLIPFIIPGVLGASGISSIPARTTPASPNSAFQAFIPPTNSIGMLRRKFVKERS